MPGLSTQTSAQTPSLQDAALPRLRDLIYEACGMFFPETRFAFLLERCRKRLTATHTDSISAYCDLVSRSKGKHDGEIRALLNEITVGETCFFRSAPQLDAIREVILPKLMAEKVLTSRRHIKIWSAGCSTGEEPYTLAILMLEQMGGQLKNFTWEIIATDLNEQSLAKAEAGLYDSYSLRNTDGRIRAKYFRPGDDRFQIAPDVRACVSFARLNLQDALEMQKISGNDLILCANVLIYFDVASKTRTVQSFYKCLQPGGHFFLGHSESLYGISTAFHLVHFSGATAYRRLPLAEEGARG